ncbi:MAG: tetratricopeptide repeat protein [Terriglobales bacterium]
MRSVFRPVVVTLLAVGILPAGYAAQVAKTAAAPDASVMARRAVELAGTGRCSEALPQLKKALGQLSDRELQRRVGLVGIHCAMTLNQSDTALDFLQVMMRNFPRDPEVLYEAVHAFSDLSTRASQELARGASGSYQAHELLAESFEMQGKWQEAEKEYRGILKQNPQAPGIHFRLGRLLLSQPSPSASVADEAKGEFEHELQIDPSNAGAEYVLGELARQHQQWDDAIAHFSRASQLDAQFAEAFLGLGVSLISAKRYADAIPPLETAIKLEPRNPDAHYNLATAYTRAGRKQEGEQEFAIHRRLTGNDSVGGTSPAQPQ